MSNADEKLVETYTSRDQGLIARYLGVKKYKMKNMSMMFPRYKRALFCKAVNEMINKHDLRAAFDIDWGEIIAASFEYLEVGRDNNEELMTCGYRLIIKDGVRFSIAVKRTWTGIPYIVISYGEDNGLDATLILDEVTKYMSENNFFLGEKIDAKGNFLTVEDLDFDMVVLPENQKKAIKVGALDFFDKKEIYEKNKIAFKRGLIFTGQPGTGKTLACKILMNKAKSTFLWVTADVLEEPEDIKIIFSMAKELSPCLVVLEDVDDYLEKTGAVDVLKTAMDGMDSISGIVTILCTNYPDRLPKSLIDRPSRFDEIIIFKLPDLSLRLKLLNKFSENMDIENRDSIFSELAEKTDGLTGAHIKELIVYALLLSADDDRDIITEDDLAKSYIKVRDTKDTATDGLSNIDVKCLMAEIKKNKGDK